MFSLRLLKTSSSCFLLIVLAFLLAGCDYYNSSSSKVTEVIDGDTIRLVNSKLVRYIGIDTPELRIKKGEEFLLAPTPFAEAARRVNSQLVADKLVKIKYDKLRQDRYGRILGYCYQGDKMVNRQLLLKGLAVVSFRPPNFKHRESFIAAEKAAREKKCGIFSDSYSKITPDQAGDYLNQIRTVRGYIQGYQQGYNKIFLTFRGGKFSILIFKNCFDLFGQKGIEIKEDYLGKLVEVTGRIRDYQRPAIIVCLPYQLRVINE
jgi:micrococcal nuclease